MFVVAQGLVLQVLHIRPQLLLRLMLLTYLPVCLPPACPCGQVRREIQPIVSRNRYRRDGTSAYQLLAEQQRRCPITGIWRTMRCC